MMKCAVLPAGMLALGITLAAVVCVSRAEIIYFGKQNPVLPAAQIARQIPWAGAALTLEYEVSSIYSSPITKKWGRLYVSTTRDTGKLLLRGDAPVPLQKGGEVPALCPAPPPLAWAGVSKLLVASWSGTLTWKGSGILPRASGRVGRGLLLSGRRCTWGLEP